MWSKTGNQKPMWIQDSNPKCKTYKEQLAEAVDREDYERAAVLRDRLKSIEEKQQG